MKKLVVVLLSIVIALSVCSCVGKETGSNGRFFLSRPTKKEKEAINIYINVLNALENYLEDGVITIYNSELKKDVKSGQALEYCYKTIEALDSVDMWIGTKYISDTRTREEILDSFTVIHDVKLHDKAVSLDTMGNIDYQYGSGYYTYNAKGQVVEGYMTILDQYFLDDSYDVSLGFAMRKYFPYNLEYTCSYGETGDIGVVENKVNRITLNYDDGKVAGVECLDADYSKKTIYSLSYDKQNRLTKADGIIYEKNNEKTVDTYNFIYDDNNVLIREEYVRAYFEGNKKPLIIEGWCIDYKYDSNGKLSSALVSYESGGELHLTVDYEKDGKLVTYNFKHIDKSGEIKDIQKKESTYGEAYIYNPKK